MCEETISREKKRMGDHSQRSPRKDTATREKKARPASRSLRVGLGGEKKVQSLRSTVFAKWRERGKKRLRRATERRGRRGGEYHILKPKGHREKRGRGKTRSPYMEAQKKKKERKRWITPAFLKRKCGVSTLNL